MSVEVIALQGLPASGKSTWARQYVEAHRGEVGIVSRDVIRWHVFGVSFDPSLEPEVTKVQHTMAHQLLVETGVSVVVDDTNMRREYLDGWDRFASWRHAGFRVVTIRTPVEECIVRDSRRERPVGEDVIRRMASTPYALEVLG